MFGQIEKELFAIVFGCEKFHHYVYGKNVIVQSDHKPLESIFKKPLNDTTLRLQRLRLRSQFYNITLCYKPGKELLLADALSRNFIKNVAANNDLEKEVESHVNMIVNTLPISKTKIDVFRDETDKDPVLSVLKFYIQSEWPSRNEIPVNLKIFAQSDQS